MPHDMDIVRTQAVVTAVARDTLPLDQIDTNIIRLFDRVYAFLRTAPVEQAGHNVALYLNDAIDLEAGVPVTDPFQDTATVHCSSLPSGRAAHTIHHGPYAQLHQAHSAVLEWCTEKGVATTGVRWEVYGDWYADQALLRTDVYYLLEE